MRLYWVGRERVRSIPSTKAKAVPMEQTSDFKMNGNSTWLFLVELQKDSLKVTFCCSHLTRRPPLENLVFFWQDGHYFEVLVSFAQDSHRFDVLVFLPQDGHHFEVLFFLPQDGHRLELLVFVVLELGLGESEPNCLKSSVDSTSESKNRSTIDGSSSHRFVKIVFHVGNLLRSNFCY